jgi:hypothetical protein
MILTALPREQLDEALDRFMARLEDPFSRTGFRRIRATSADRAVGAAAERHRRAALSLARSLGMAVHADGVECAFNWDGRALDGATEAYVILHEAAHFVLAPSERRRLVDFGLGPGPDTRDRDAAARAAVLSPLAREWMRRQPHCSGSSGRRSSVSPRSPPSSIRTGSKGSTAPLTPISPQYWANCSAAVCSTLHGPPYSIERRRIEAAEPPQPEPQNRAAGRIPPLRRGANARS